LIIRKHVGMTSLHRYFIVSGLILALAGCATVPKPAEGPALPPPPAVKLSGLDAVMGHNANSLVSLFGKPDQDLREANGRRLQFSGGNCVLDAYLYPPVPGREALVTYIDARLPDGRDTDRAGCVTALMKARGR
jgi:hypothetical protein